MAPVGAAAVASEQPVAPEPMPVIPAIPRLQQPQMPPPILVQRRVPNDGHQTVVSVALPFLKQVMLEDDWCTKPPRSQVHEALSRVDRIGERFWGANLTYSRKRTVEDLILRFYIDDVRSCL